MFNLLSKVQLKVGNSTEGRLEKVLEKMQALTGKAYKENEEWIVRHNSRTTKMIEEMQMKTQMLSVELTHNPLEDELHALRQELLYLDPNDKLTYSKILSKIQELEKKKQESTIKS